MARAARRHARRRHRRGHRWAPSPRRCGSCPRGQLFVGTARRHRSSCCSTWSTARWPGRAGKGTPFGAVLDSTCDRIADGALFAALTWWALGVGQARVLGVGRPDLPRRGAADLLHQGAGRGGGPARGRRARRAGRAADPRPSSAPGSPGLGRAVRAGRGAVGARGGVAVDRGATAGRGPSQRPRSPARARGAVNLTDLQYAAGWRLVRLLPARVARAVFRLGADLAVRRNGPGVRQLRANLARLGAAHRTRDGMRSYARYWCETFRLAAADGPRMVAGTTVTNRGAVPRGPRHRPRPDHRPVAQRQLGRGGRLADRDPASPRAGAGVHHGRAAPAARVGVPAVRRAPGGAGLRHGRGGGLPRAAATAARRRGRVRARRPRRPGREPRRHVAGGARAAAVRARAAGRADRRHAAADPAGVLARRLDDRVRRARPVPGPPTWRRRRRRSATRWERSSRTTRPAGTSCSRCGRPTGA